MSEPLMFTFTKTARIVDGKRIPMKPETVTAKLIWASPEVERALAIAAIWRFCAERWRL